LFLAVVDNEAKQFLDHVQESFEGDGVLTGSESLIQGCGVELEAFDSGDEGNDDVLSIDGHLLLHLEVRVLEG